MRNELLNSFLLDREIINEIFLENRDVISYFISKNEDKQGLITSEIEGVINSSFWDLIEWNDKDEIIEKLEKFENDITTIDWYLDIYTEDLIKSLHFLWTDIEIPWVNESFEELVRNYQFELYLETFDNIKEKFIEFLKK